MAEGRSLGEAAHGPKADSRGPPCSRQCGHSAQRGQDLLRTETMMVSAAGQHARACDQSMFSMRSRAFAYPPQRSRGRLDSAGNVKKADLLLRMRVVERMNRLGGRLQQDRAALFRKKRLSFRR